MRIAYTNYAEEALTVRKISKGEIELALLNPEKISDGKQGRKIVHKTFGNKLLRVIFETEGNAYIVITAYYTNPERYMGK